MSYTIYRKDTGEVLRIVQCDADQLSIQIQSGEDYLEGSYINHYVEAGTPISLPQKPSETSIFDYVTKTWKETLTSEVQWRKVKFTRNQLLQGSDWTQLPDVPLATKEAWATYRQELRDVTLQPDPFNIVWPQAPQ